MAQTPEAKVKAAVKKLLAEYKIWYYMPVQNGMGRVGIPDFICCWKGRFLAIETKAPGKIDTLTPNQERNIKQIWQAGGRAMVIDNVDILRKVIENDNAAE